MLHCHGLPVPRPQINLQRPPKQLQQHLEARLRNRGIIPPLAELIPDKRVLRPRELVPREHDPSVPQLLPDQVAAGVGHVRVLNAEEQRDLAFKLRKEVERVRAVGGRRGGRVGGCVGA